MKPYLSILENSPSNMLVPAFVKSKIFTKRLLIIPKNFLINDILIIQIAIVICVKIPIPTNFQEIAFLLLLSKYANAIRVNIPINPLNRDSMEKP